MALAYHLRAVIEYQRAWPATALNKLIEPPRHPRARDTKIYQLANTQARVIVANVQDPDAPTVRELVVNEVC
jgi:hypothetical protein